LRANNGHERTQQLAYTGRRSENFVGQHFWARGYFVSTVGRDTEVIRDYIKKQEEEDKRLEQLRTAIHADKC
jgi:REP element-mobilizing transposase RayT